MSNQGTNFSPKFALGSFLATYIAGVVHPLELVKTRLQSHDGKADNNLVPKYRGTFQALRKIHKHEGFMGLYKGFHVSVFSQAIASAIFFWVYEIEKQRYSDFGNLQSVVMASTEAGVFTAAITQPLWMIRTRMVLNLDKGIGEVKNFVFTAKQVWRQDGLKGFGKGLGLSFLLSLTGVVQMTVYEVCQNLFGAMNLPQNPLLDKNFLSGGISKAAVVLLSYPVTTVRTRIQQNQFVKDSKIRKYNSVSQVIKSMLKDEGVRGFYKGMWANLVKGVLQKGIYFYWYELFKGFMMLKPPEPEDHA